MRSPVGALLAFGLVSAFLSPLEAFAPAGFRPVGRLGRSALSRNPTGPRHAALSLRASAVSNPPDGNIFSDLFGLFGKPSETPSQPEAAAPAETEKVGILFLNLGGPESLDEVEDFLFNLFNDPDIIRLPGPLKPLQSFIARRIASSRAPQSREAYESIGGGSPIVKLTVEQGERLEEELARRGVESKSYVGMRYWYPFTEEAVDRLLKDGVTRLVVLPLYPQYSISTSGSSLRLLDQMMEDSPREWDPRKIDHTVVPAWFGHPGYVATQARLILDQLGEFEGNPRDVKVMFSAHGVPVSYVEAGDPYKGHVEDCASMIMDKVNEGRSEADSFDWTLAFQSRVGPVKWLEPYTDDVLNKLGEGGLENLVVVPLSFVSEHVETLEEIDIEYREVAEEAGIKNFKRVPALNSDPGFISCLADIAQEALEKPSLRVAEALELYQGKSMREAAAASSDRNAWLRPGISISAEAINGRAAMVAFASLAISQVINKGCPAIAGPSIAGKEPFCAAFSYDGWAWLLDVILNLQT
uniref:Ferrochelatase n=1 Tax=Hemiselmis tepida TaxID=464990 RepID=A0A7S0Z4I5_9CRYP|mmetsp:Transcript_8352/g.21615  ORF Transcript_8352/g.21615 Transcript_8352/m.21615 type:complete len:527 (+) Transcript_8352:201-1781(+)